MKLFNTITACLLLCAGLVSCEMKDELKGSGAGTSEVGYLSLGVAVNASQNSVVSRADDVTDDGKNENVGVAVSADEFPVTITGVTDPSYSKEYESYAALKAENGGKVELPIGEYTVTAHSNAELEPQMATPYYEGTTPIKITAGVESSAEVKCTMKNMKIQLTYTANFLTKFESWDITINDGSDNILNFDETDKNPAAVYWLVAENVTEIKVAITATPTGGGQEVTESRLLSKPDDSNWAGSDALTIQMEEKTSEDPTGIQGSGITINASVSFDEYPEDVPVTVKPGGGSSEEPEEPGAGGDEDEEGEEPENPEPSEEKPTVSSSYSGQTITFSKAQNNAPEDVVVDMSAPNGIQHVYIKATTTDRMLQGIFTAMGFMTSDGLDFVGLAGNEAAGDIAPLFEKLPEKGDTSYSFVLGSLATMLTVGEHSFTVIVVDQEGTPSDPVTVYFNVTE